MRYVLYIIFFYVGSVGCKRPYNKSTAESIQSKVSKTNQSPEKIRPIDTAIMSFWNEFIEVARLHNFKRFKNLSDASITGCGTTIPIDTFIEKCFVEVFSDTLFFIISDKSKILFPEIDSFPEKRVQVYMIETSPDGPWVKTFNFIQTKAGYRFHSCDSYGGPKCCQW